MRLEGFEPPTRGLEGRRSSSELQAPAARVAPALGPCIGGPCALRIEEDGQTREAPFRVAVRLEVDLAQNDRTS